MFGPATVPIVGEISNPYMLRWERSKDCLVTVMRGLSPGPFKPRPFGNIGVFTTGSNGPAQR